VFRTGGVTTLVKGGFSSGDCECMACIIIQLGHLFALPLHNEELRQCNSHIALEVMKTPSVMVSANGKQQIIRQKGTGKCTEKLWAFCAKRTPPSSAWSHKPGKRIKSSRSTSCKPHSLQMQHILTYRW
jgi:hypothetical protein